MSDVKTLTPEEKAALRIVTIPSDNLYGNYEVNLYRPKYKDYSAALKLFPGQTRENPQGPGYTVEEFLCALCLRTPLGKEPDTTPKDAIDRFNDVDLRDKQFIARTFISAFVLDQELLEEAEALADSLIEANPTDLAYTLQADDLPSKQHSITFHRPNAAVQIHVSKIYTSEKVNGCTWEELFFLHCLTHIDGEPVQKVPNLLSLVSDFDLLDVQYAAAVFLKMFAMTASQRKQAGELGKQWRTPSSSLSQSSKAKSATQPKTEATKPAA